MRKAESQGHTVDINLCMTSTKPGVETFTEAEIVRALGEYLAWGEHSVVPNGRAIGYGHRGYYSGDGWPARVLRYHLAQLTKPMTRRKR